MANSTATGSIEQDPFDEKGDIGFYASDIEPWITILCEDCEMAVHDSVAVQLQAKYLQKKKL